MEGLSGAELASPGGGLMGRFVRRCLGATTVSAIVTLLLCPSCGLESLIRASDQRAALDEDARIQDQRRQGEHALAAKEAAARTKEQADARAQAQADAEAQRQQRTKADAAAEAQVRDYQEWVEKHPDEVKAQKRKEFSEMRATLSSELCLSAQAERGHLDKIRELKRDARIAGVISLSDLHDQQTWVVLWRKVERAYRSDLQEMHAKPRSCSSSEPLTGDELVEADNGSMAHNPKDFFANED